MAEDGCYGWEEVYEACGCSADYLDADPGELVVLVTPHEATQEGEVTLVEPVDEPLIDLSRAIEMTIPMIPSPG